jgi:hypothetical protein
MKAFKKFISKGNVIELAKDKTPYKTHFGLTLPFLLRFSMSGNREPPRSQHLDQIHQ